MIKKEWNGLKIIEKTLKAQERALEAVGIFVEGEAIARCPYDTYRLINSISHIVKENWVKIGTNVEYAPFVEYGTSKQDPQPYLRPAVDNNHDKIRELFREQYQEAIK